MWLKHYPSKKRFIKFSDCSGQVFCAKKERLQKEVTASNIAWRQFLKGKHLKNFNFVVMKNFFSGDFHYGFVYFLFHKLVFWIIFDLKSLLSKRCQCNKTNLNLLHSFLYYYSIANYMSNTQVYFKYFCFLILSE